MEGQERKKGHPSTAELGEVGKKVCRTGKETRGGEAAEPPFWRDARGRRVAGQAVQPVPPQALPGGTSDSPGDKGQGAGGIPPLVAAGGRGTLRDPGPLERSQTVLLQRTRGCPAPMQASPAATSLGRNARPREAGKGVLRAPR